MEEYMLSDCELIIMKVIWRSEEKLCLQDVVDQVNSSFNKDWKYSTVSAFIGRIVKKKMLTSERRGRLFFYTPTITEEEYRKKETLRCVDTLGDGQADVFLAALAKARELTNKEKEAIRGLLNELG